MLIRATEHVAAQHLVNALKADPKIEIKLGTNLIAAHGQEKLEALTFKNILTEAEETQPASALFVFIGVKPQSDLVKELVLRDDTGYVLTGMDVMRAGQRPANWPLDRDPFMFETNVPGLFAAGDVRFGTIHRVVSATSEGGAAVTMIRQYLKTL